ncbi:hypothetical protein H8E88_12375 [candidate division KSB1 bacterium]|nr:hypothetical protein [candidate division KSB1 bacterium]MBL7095316.1 hypothetical protein [candidate division KSB1 bacterium]
MNNLPEILEQELEEAVEVKSKKSLHRYIVLLTDNIIQKNVYYQNTNEIKSEVRILAETMKEGFKAVDKRFEDLYRYMDNRFEDMNRRFNMMFTFMSVGFTIIVLLTVLFKFIQ